VNALLWAILLVSWAGDGGENVQFKLHSPASHLLLIVIIISCCVKANSQTCGYLVQRDQKVRVAALPSTVAASTSESDVLVASVATAVMNRDICCGRRSALEDQIIVASASTGKISLRELGEKLRGKHYLDDGSSIFVADQFWPAASIVQKSVTPGDIINSLMAQRPLLMNWAGHLYVLYGVAFDVCIDNNSGAEFPSIRTLLLVDTRFSGTQRYVSFNVQTDDWGKVTGLLALAITHNK